MVTVSEKVGMNQSALPGEGIGMEKEQIYYGELVPVTDGESARIPTIVIIQNNTKDHSSLSEKAEEIQASFKDGQLLPSVSLAVSRLIREQDVAVLMTAQVCPVDSSCRKELAGRLNAAAMQYVDQAVASSFGLGEILAQNDIYEEKQKEERGEQ